MSLVSRRGWRTADDAVALRVDWQACQGRGVCAAAAPTVVALDRWGYPVPADRVSTGEVRAAREAVSLCPHAALRLVRVGPGRS